MDWQSVIAISIVALAAWRVLLELRRFFSASTSKSSCGSCQSCPSHQAQPTSSEFVPLQLHND